MNMKKTVIVAILVVIVGILAVIVYFAGVRNNADTGGSGSASSTGAGSGAVAYADALSACGSYPNGATVNVKETDRITIKLPENSYPNQSGYLPFTNVSGTAKASWISNAGPLGASYGATSDCRAWYYEFDGRGEVDLKATSSVVGVPEYDVRFVVGPTDSSSSAAGTGSRVIVQGSVLLGPTCPVEQNPPQPGCAPKPYETTIKILPAGSLTPLATVSSNASGTFSVSLAPGTYTLQAQGGNGVPPTCRPLAVTVKAGAAQTVTIQCDTGIR